MATLPEMPVLSFRANWKEPMTERLSFLTDVITAAQGAEQRRSVRETPRRYVEVDLLLSGPERAFYDLFINRLGAAEVLIPLYWDIASLTSATVANTTTRLNFDNRYREFAPGKAIITGKTALDYEVVTVSAVDANGITLGAAVKRPWPVGTKIMPLRRGLIDQAGTLSHKSAGVATVTLGLSYTQSNPWTAAPSNLPLYNGVPVMTVEPNFADDLDDTADRQTARFDSDVGRVYQVDPLGRSLRGQAHSFFLHGRARLAWFRDLIYRNRGRAGSFWLPTFKADLRLTNNPLAAATQIEVANVGYGYTGGPVAGREYIAIRHPLGTIFRKVLSVVPGPTLATEKLNLDAPLGLDLRADLAPKISFLDMARFDSDTFEIVHHGGPDGLHEVATGFRNFKATRTAPMPISLDIPESVKRRGACGTGGEEPPPIFWRIRLDWSATLRPFPGQYPYIYGANIRQPSPVFPAGGYLKDNANVNRVNANPSVDNGQFIIQDVPGGFDVLDLDGVATIYTFRWYDVDANNSPGGYEWNFFFAADYPGEFGFSHQFQRSQLPTGNDYPAILTFTDFEVDQIVSVDTVVFRTFPQGFGINWSV